MDYNYQNFREVLQEEFEKRLVKNKRYSMRAFARDLNMIPTRMYEIMKGRYGISNAAARDLASALHFNKQKTDFFCLLVEAEHARTPQRKQLARKQLEKLRRPFAFEDLDLDRYLVLADWVHSAILELTQHEDFDSSSDWVARRLKVPAILVNAAIERLQRLDLLKNENGVLKKTRDFVAVSSPNTPSTAIQQAHARVMEKAQVALFTQPPDKRDFNSLVMGIPRSRFGFAKEEILKFLKGLCVQLQAPGQPIDSVYCLGLQFFELTDGAEEMNQAPKS